MKEGHWVNLYSPQNGGNQGGGNLYSGTLRAWGTTAPEECLVSRGDSRKGAFHVLLHIGERDIQGRTLVAYTFATFGNVG